MTDSSKLFKNYYDINGNLLSGELTQVFDEETKEMLIYVGGVRVFRIFDANAKATVQFLTKDNEICHSIEADVDVSTDPKVLFRYDADLKIVTLPEMTNFKLDLIPAEGKLVLNRQEPNNEWMAADLRTAFQLCGPDMVGLFIVHFVENVGCVFKGRTLFIEAGITSIVITVQTD